MVCEELFEHLNEREHHSSFDESIKKKKIQILNCVQIHKLSKSDGQVNKKLIYLNCKSVSRALFIVCLY